MMVCDICGDGALFQNQRGTFCGRHYEVPTEGYEKTKATIPRKQGDELLEYTIARVRGWPKTGSGWCYDCEHYRLTESEARAVARKLAQLERFERELRELTTAHADGLNRLLAIEKKAATLSEMLVWALQSEAKSRQKQICGHERRFIVTRDDSDIDPQGKSDRGKTGWCALCGLESLRADLEEATNETD